MGAYIVKRVLLLPLTLFLIIVVNFCIINLAPGDPITVADRSEQGDLVGNQERGISKESESEYLQFRERYGLTVPILFNLWPYLSKADVLKNLNKLVNDGELSVKKAHQLKIKIGDQAKFIMPILLEIAEDSSFSLDVRKLASNFFVRGGTKQGIVGARLSKEEKLHNRKISYDNNLLGDNKIKGRESKGIIEDKIATLRPWYDENVSHYQFEPTKFQKMGLVFKESRFFRYMKKFVTLDFGTLRNDDGRTVIKEVSKRIKYSLVLAFVPMLITFIFCQVLGFFMAAKYKKWQDHTLNLILLGLYAVPVFVVAPWLIEKVAASFSLPISGFTSSNSIYETLTSKERLVDLLRHIALPMVAIIYGSFAVQSRLSKTAVLEVLRQDYIRTAKAKGLSFFQILVKHVAKNASITIVTALAGSLGVILAGSLIIETIFEIDGFGRFFYEAVVNRDYNVIMFSAIAGSFLALLGYLLADIAYTILDPRVTLD